LLLGMVSVDGVAGRLLREVDISPQQVYATLRNKLEVLHATDGPVDPLPWSLRLQYAIDAAKRIAVDLGEPLLGTSHVLMALAEPVCGVAAAVLASLGTSAAELRERHKDLALRNELMPEDGPDELVEASDTDAPLGSFGDQEFARTPKHLPDDLT